MATAASFPTTDSEFVTYSNKAVPHLIANKVRLKVTNTNANLINTKLVELKAVWLKSEDTTQSTQLITGQKDKRIKEMTNLLKAIYADIPQSALTDEDKKKLNISDRKPQGDRPKITTAPHVDLKVGDGGTIKVTCRVESDSTRASRHEDADVIEMAYQLGGDAPAGASETSLKQTFNKAIHTLHFDVAKYAKKDLFAFFRWRNNVDPEKSSPWSQRMNIVISN